MTVGDCGDPVAKMDGGAERPEDGQVQTREIKTKGDRPLNVGAFGVQ